MDNQQSNSQGYGSITKPTQYSNERAEARKSIKQQGNITQQGSTNRRVLRETQRAATTGRASSWLRNYASQKDAEFNSQNSTLQQTVSPSASVTYSKTYDSPDIVLSTRQNSNKSSFTDSGGGVSVSPTGYYDSSSTGAMSTSSQFFDL